MRFDKENQLSAAQAFTGAATVSTNSYKKQSIKQSLSIGRMMALMVMATVAAGAGSTHTLEAISATDSALTGSVTILGSITVLAADLIPGAVFQIPIPPRSDVQMYIGFRNTSTGGTTTVTLDVYLCPQDEIPVKFLAFPKVVDTLV